MIYDLRNYTDDELDAELGALGIAFTADTSAFDKNMLISNVWDMIRSAVKRGRQQRPEDEPGKMDVRVVKADVFYEMSRISTIEKRHIISIA